MSNLPPLPAMPPIRCRLYKPTEVMDFARLYAEITRTELLGTIAAQPAVCEWHEDSDGLWQMQCGGDPWLFESGGVVENRVTFCMHCGKRVAVLAAEAPETNDQNSETEAP